VSIAYVSHDVSLDVVSLTGTTVDDDAARNKNTNKRTAALMRMLRMIYRIVYDSTLQYITTTSQQSTQ
jgi:hypothetical protein